jgi:hypothetical protein
MEHELVGFGIKARPERGILLADTSEDLGDFVFVATGLGHDGEGVQGSGVWQRLVMDMVQGVIVVKDVAQVYLFDLGDRAHVPGDDFSHRRTFFPLHLKEMA